MTWEKKDKIDPENAEEPQRFIRTETAIVAETTIDELETRKADLEDRVVKLQAEIANIEKDIAEIKTL
jgi:molecular chaperone GrpE (heat shock protein)